MSNIWLDGMMGLITGDALGCPVQFKSRHDIRETGLVTTMEGYGTFNMPEGTWTDDSSMALATLSSLKSLNQIDPDDIMHQFIHWLNDGAYTPFGQAFDLGCTCTGAILSYTKSEDVQTCGRRGEHANGNGALMRILPVCLYILDQKAHILSDAEAIEKIHLIAGLTHNHIRSHIACGLYYFMVKSILNLRESKDLMTCLQTGIDDGLRFYGQDAFVIPELSHYHRLFHLDAFKDTPVSMIHSSGYVVDTLEAAIWSLLQSDHFAASLLVAVNLGDDTDTVAAVAGGLAGLYYGYEKIPADWLDAIQNKALIAQILQSDL